MRRVRLATAGLLALVASLALVTTSSDRSAPGEAPPGSQRATAAAPRPIVAFAPTSSSGVRTAPDALQFAARAARSGSYLPGERLVRLTDPMELPDIAARYDLDVVRPTGRSGYAVLRGAPDALDQLVGAPGVAAMARHGIVYGATDEVFVADSTMVDDDDILEGTCANGRKRRMGSSEHEALQWYIDKIDPPRADTPAVDVVVAVVDTGVAYETVLRDGIQYAQAPSLAGSLIVAPYDFVNDDPYANDDHQHGTHIASLVASNGTLKGAAPGVSLMPVKVLDEHNQGTEYALIEGIWWAVDHGADIINLSLSFGPSYHPSDALLEALQAAAAADVLMVAASGNDGLDRISWPAASPLVLAVGAAELTDEGGDYSALVVAPYSNVDAGIDIVAPGGNLDTDLDADGYPDGIVAETIDPTDPAAVGYWMMAGTSQAAAQVSGLAVELVRAGMSALDAESALKFKAEAGNPKSGRGSGYADMDWAVPHNSPYNQDFYVAMLPYLQADGSQVRPRVRVSVFRPSGDTANNVLVAGTLWGNGDGIVSCTTDATGQCFLEGAAIDRFGADGSEVAFAWSLAVQSIAVGNGARTFRPKAALTHTEGFDELVASLGSDAALSHALLAWSWSDSTDAELGQVADSYGLVDSGAGLTSLPLGLVMTGPVLGGLGSTVTQTVGVSDAEVAVTLLTLDGSGLTSLPLGLRSGLEDGVDLAVAFVDGTGLTSLPLGFRIGEGTLVPLDEVPATLGGTALGAKLAEGGWRVDGYGAATMLGSSAALGISPALTPEALADMGGVSMDVLYVVP